MTFTYNTNIPDAPNNPSVDQPKMKTNTNSINSLINVDHVSFNTANGGYHKVIHFIKQASNPAAIASVGQLFTKDYTPDTTVPSTPDTQLFYETGGGGTSQLTGNFAAAANGWCWVGGILVQWGRNTSTSSGSFAGGNAAGTITFKSRAAGMIPFPTACFEVITTPFYAGSVPSGAAAVGVQLSTLSNTGFSWRFNSNSSDYTGFFWWAIGN